MKIYLFLLAISVFGFTANAQNFKYGKVSPEELEEFRHPIDSTAGAAVLFHSSTTKFRYEESAGFVMETFVQTRIKIYSEAGLDWANHTIMVRETEGLEEKVTGLKGITYLYANGVIIDVKLKKSDIVEENINEFWNKVSFTMPDVEVGSVIEFKYMIRSPFYWKVPIYDLQFEIPTKKLVNYFESPEYFNYKMNISGILPVKPKFSTRVENIAISKGNSSTRGVTDLYGGKTSSNIDYTKNHVSVNYDVTRIELENVEALKRESFIDNLNNYRSQIRFELKYVQYPNKPARYQNKGWDDVTKNLYNSTKFGWELAKVSYYEEDLSNIIAQGGSEEELLAKVFYFVKNAVKWNGFRSIYTNHGVKAVYKTGEGNVAEINLMLTSMLKTAGLEAYPVLASTLDNGKPITPTTDGFNYVLASVILDGKVVLLDATGNFNSLNTLPLRILNWEGRLLKPDGTSYSVSLYPAKTATKISSLSYKVLPSGLIKGSARTQHNSYRALEFRNKYLSKNEDEYLNYLKADLLGAKISDYQVENLLKFEESIIESYHFESNNQAILSGDTILIKPLSFLGLDENLFTNDDRKYPLYFKYPFKDKVTIVLTIPEGYSIKSMPENMIVNLPDKLGTYKFYISEKDGTVSLMVTNRVNKSMISAAYYGTIQEYYQKIIAQEKLAIVLVKDPK